MNAIDYTFELEPLVLFLSNPFGRETLGPILGRLEASLRAKPREAYVIYINPRFEASVRTARFLQKIREGGAWWRPWRRYVVYAKIGIFAQPLRAA
jgi:hypothetical protein